MPSVTYDKAQSVSEYLERRLVENVDVDIPVDRRAVLGGLGLAGSAALGLGSASADDEQEDGGDGDHGNFGATGQYTGDFDPHEYLRSFNTGQSGQENVEQEVYEEDGETVRHFYFNVSNEPIEIAPGIEFMTWAFNGQVPGPTIRAVEGDVIRITLDVNGSHRHAHTIHPHLKNINPEMDGIPQNGPGLIDPEQDPFTYEWRAQPAGVHFYHCHALPLKEHMHRGMYGVFVIDPDPERVRENPRDYVNYQGPITDEYRDRLVEEAKQRNHTTPENDDVNEMVMVMNAFDTNFDGKNEVYAANSRAFAYSVGQTDGEGEWTGTKRPIQIDKNRRHLVYLVNTTEFDPINSFHTHSQFFDYYDHGTTLEPTHKTVDTVMQCQAQRGIIDLDYSDHQPGLYMFHAHQSEFAELGWMSFFEVV